MLKYYTFFQKILVFFVICSRRGSKDEKIFSKKNQLRY